MILQTRYFMNDEEDRTGEIPCDLLYFTLYTVCAC